MSEVSQGSPEQSGVYILSCPENSGAGLRSMRSQQSPPAYMDLRLWRLKSVLFKKILVKGVDPKYLKKLKNFQIFGSTTFVKYVLKKQTLS